MNVGARLEKFLAEDQPVPFDWAQRNCCHAAAAWVACLTGTDPMAGLPATPDALGARRLLRAWGGNLQAAVSARLQLPSVLPTEAHTGDVALLYAMRSDGVGGSLGIVSGRHVWSITDHGHWQAQPLDGALCAWRVAP